MKLHPHTPVDRAKHMLAIGLAAVLTASPAFAQTDADSLRRLQEENAALRRQLAEMQGRTAPAPVAAQPATATSTPAPVVTQSTGPAQQTPDDPDTLVLSPFQVRSDKDYGYLKTNSATATRIGTEIQKVPLSVSVISEDFIKDTQMSDIQDVLRYQASSAGDTRMGVLQPATGFTPSGNMSLRGFPINSRLRNGLLRYNAYSLDNVERVEIIKGPAAVFFGQAYPGGVINYVTKKPSFSKIPTTINYSYGGYDTRMGTQRATMDNNTVLSDKAAMRVVGAWDNAKGDRRFEYQQGFSVTPSFTLVPFADGRLRITAEAEFLRRERNQDDTSWAYPQGWFDAYKNPSAALIAAAGLSGNADPVAAYRARIFAGPGNWIADRRVAENNPGLALWTEEMQHGAYITDASGNRVHDEKFNYYGVGTYSDEESNTFSVDTEFAPVEWFNLRHSFTTDNSSYTEVKSSASPNADGVTWQTLNGIIKRDYIIDGTTHQLDLVLKKELAGIDNKFLVGGLIREVYSTFTGTNGAVLNGTGLFPFFGYLPGAYDKLDEGYVSPIPVAFRHPQPTAWGYASQFIRDRSGKILTPMEIFSRYDPGVHIAPDIRRITEVSRGLTDHGRPKREEWYVNYQATALDGKLTAMLGYREEKSTSVGQLVKANPPWFGVGDNALENIPQNQWALYGLSAIFSRPSNTKGDSKMAGLSYEVRPNVNVYASFSQTFLPSGVTYLGGDYDPATVRTRATLLGLNPDTEVQRINDGGGITNARNETGQNMEIGVKTSLADNKIVGTFSLFRLDRENRTLEDIARINNDPINYTGPNRTGSFNRVVRWYTDTAVERTEGAEFEIIWTPVRNYQAIISGSWMWTAETVEDPTIAPTSPIYAPVFQSRLAFVPEYRLNFFNKYTFTSDIFGDIGRGLSIGGGFRYSSEMNINPRDLNFNPLQGAIGAGDYLVFDALITYPFEMLGYQMTAGLNVNNVLDEEYSEGGFNLSPPRSWLVSLGMKF